MVSKRLAIGDQRASNWTTVGRLLTERTFDSRFPAFLWQRLSVAIQRDNALSVFGTIPAAKCLDEIFYPDFLVLV